ncbi:MAG: hypothetical protein U0892_18520 [Pirellulales bacterium]
MRAVLDEWSSSSSFADRISDIRGTGKATRRSSNTFFNGTTILDDAMADALTGGSDSDWFWINSQNDVVTDSSSNDQTN